MTRSISSGLNTAISSETSALFHLIQLDFSGGTVFLTTAPHDIPFNSNTYEGIGGALTLDAVQEGADISANSLNVTLSGVDKSIITKILGQFYIGRNAKIHMAHIDSSGNVVSDPLLIFSGRMNGGFEIDETVDPDSPGTVTVIGRMVDRLGDLDRIAGVRANLRSHQAFFDGDKFFEFVQPLVSQRLDWGEPGALE